MFLRDDILFLRHKEGRAYYYAYKDLYLKELPFKGVNINHMLTGELFNQNKDNLTIVPWGDIPESYRMDACSMNKFIRTHCTDYPFIGNKILMWVARMYTKWCVR